MTIQNEEKIRVYLPKEATEVWRTVSAEHIDGNIYRIIEQRIPESEVWDSFPGETVYCEKKVLLNGSKPVEVIVAKRRKWNKAELIFKLIRKLKNDDGFKSLLLQAAGINDYRICNTPCKAAFGFESCAQAIIANILIKHFSKTNNIVYIGQKPLKKGQKFNTKPDISIIGEEEMFFEIKIIKNDDFGWIVNSSSKNSDIEKLRKLKKTPETYCFMIVIGYPNSKSCKMYRAERKRFGLLKFRGTRQREIKNCTDLFFYFYFVVNNFRVYIFEISD